MPVYEYRCKTCGRTHEIEHGFHDERPSRCPACGGPLSRVFAPVGIVFKGSGFHKTDYARSGMRKEAKTGTEAAKTDGSAKSGSSTGEAAGSTGDAGSTGKPKAKDSAPAS
jgi:putative FmdB family regulatory protein